MQVDQFESEVESLSVQTRKKKGDKDVSRAGTLRVGGLAGGTGAPGRGQGLADGLAQGGGEAGSVPSG